MVHFRFIQNIPAWYIHVLVLVDMTTGRLLMDRFNMILIQDEQALIEEEAIASMPLLFCLIIDRVLGGKLNVHCGMHLAPAASCYCLIIGTVRLQNCMVLSQNSCSD